ncbi:MAG: TPM domain-containing protein [Verrucomicrobia bacterium]|nr:TPM domain-containing protein [Verrucomicrobiota bacterium]
MKRSGLIVCLLWCACLTAAEVIPPKPEQYFNDYAGVVPTPAARQLNEKLATFERDTSSQIVVAVFSKMESRSSLEDYTIRIAKSWQVGQNDKRNGAVMFVFINERKLRIEVGYGLEGVLPDAICKRIISDTITPRFRNGDYAGGLAAGVDALIAAAKGEYKGTGRTVAERGGGLPSWVGPLFFLVFLLFLLSFLIAFIRAARGAVYSGRGYRRSNSWNWSSGGGSWGGGSSSGGSSFSGGGGDFGGGGASGSW